MDMPDSQESSLIIEDGTETEAHVLPYNFIRKHGVLVTGIENGIADVLYKPGCKVSAFSELKRHLNCSIKLQKVKEEEFEKKIAEFYESGSSRSTQVMDDISEDMDLSHVAMGLAEPEDLLDTQDDAPIIRLINALLTEALKEGASDIHIEPSPITRKTVIRFRTDGVCHEYVQVPNTMAPALVSRIKIMANMDIAEKRLPQDGKIKLRRKGIPEFELRVSSMPTAGGFEDVVLRILASSMSYKLQEIGLNERNLGILEKIIAYEAVHEIKVTLS